MGFMFFFFFFIDICEIRMKFFEKNDIQMVPIEKNLVDEVWMNKPPKPQKTVFN